MIENETQIRQLLIALDGVEKYVICIQDPFGQNISDYINAMKLMKNIMNKLLKYLPNYKTTNNKILAIIKKDIQAL